MPHSVEYVFYVLLYLEAGTHELCELFGLVVSLQFLSFLLPV